MNTTVLTTKARAIRDKLTEQGLPHDPPRDDTYDAEKNIALFKETEALSNKLGTQAYMVMWGEVPACTIIIRCTEKKTSVWATRFVNGRRVMFKGCATGYDFDRITSALEGLSIPPVHSYYEQGKSPAHFVLRDQGRRWYHQFEAEGFKIWRTL